MDLFLGVLQTFPNEVAIETKVLGLLNNIAEVKELRSYIMDVRFIQELRKLMKIVSQWETPDTEMVAYRSFTPFFPLMAVEQEYSVQLWAVWAIHHVCSKNPRRYLPMLVYQEGI